MTTWVRRLCRSAADLSPQRPDERGAVAVVVAASIALLMVVAALAVDLGMQRVLRRDLQALADVAALDLSRQIPGKTVSQLNAVAPSILVRTLSANHDAVGETISAADLFDFEFGTATMASDGSTAFVAGAPGSFPSAVRVTASNDIGFGFARLIGTDEGSASRSAIATVEGGACFGIGSYAAQLDTGASPLLGPLLGALGSNITLTAANYEAIAGLDVDLLSLLGVDVGAGTLEELVRGDELVNLGDFYLAVAEVAGQGSGNTAAVGLLESIGVAVVPLNVLIPANELISLGSGGTAGLEAALNALDLVTAGAAIANGENALSLPAVGVNLGPLANVRSTVSVIEGPKIGCGRKNEVGAVGQSSAARVALSLSALDLPLGILNSRVSLTGNVEVASAEGRLTDVRCDPSGITVRVADGLVRVDLTLNVNIDAIFGLIPAISGPIRITGQSTSVGDAVINLPNDPAYDNPVTVPNSSNGLPDLQVDTSGLRALGLPLGALVQNIVLGPLLNVLVNPLIQSLDALVLTPLLRSLGLDLSGADIFAKKYPKCDAATLRG